MAQLQRSSDSVYLDLVAFWSEDRITNGMDDGARGKTLMEGLTKARGAGLLFSWLYGEEYSQLVVWSKILTISFYHLKHRLLYFPVW